MLDAPPPVFPSASGEEPWDDEEAADLLGKLVLVGITWLKADGETVSAQGQYHGRVRKVDRNEGIVIDCEGRWAGEVLTLPPATSWFDVANRGEYRLRSTGELLTDPDFISSWTVHEPHLA